MFADDTNLFFSNCNIPVLFANVNSEISKINQWFLANKLSLNVTKTKYSFFHKTSKKDDIPLKLPRLQINNYNIERIRSVKFWGVLLDENLSWKDHIKYTENKISKNTGILYKVKDYLSKQSLLPLYYTYIHTYVNYANLAWESTIRTNFKKIHSQQKHAIHIIIHMHKIKTETAPPLFLSKFQKPAHPYPTNFSKFNYKKPTSQLSRSKYRTSVRGPALWNEFLTVKGKSQIYCFLKVK